jgi:hypothetical protein
MVVTPASSGTVEMPDDEEDAYDAADETDEAKEPDRQRGWVAEWLETSERREAAPSAFSTSRDEASMQADGLTSIGHCVGWDRTENGDLMFVKLRNGKRMWQKLKGPRSTIVGRHQRRF